MLFPNILYKANIEWKWKIHCLFKVFFFRKIEEELKFSLNVPDFYFISQIEKKIMEK
jgi:hypothetical protein